MKHMISCKACQLPIIIGNQGTTTQLTINGKSSEPKSQRLSWQSRLYESIWISRHGDSADKSQLSDIIKFPRHDDSAGQSRLSDYIAFQSSTAQPANHDSVINRYQRKQAQDDISYQIPQHSSQLKAGHTHCSVQVSTNSSGLAAQGKNHKEVLSAKISKKSALFKLIYLTVEASQLRTTTTNNRALSTSKVNAKKRNYLVQKCRAIRGVSNRVIQNSSDLLTVFSPAYSSARTYKLALTSNSLNSLPAMLSTDHALATSLPHCSAYARSSALAYDTAYEPHQLSCKQIKCPPAQEKRSALTKVDWTNSLPMHSSTDHTSGSDHTISAQDCGSLRQSGPRPDPRLLRQATVEALTRSA
ncbi:hypothetical protein F511_03944 [Dorcoceras hygrometricum]|uniref:Uncharacterized protein n=1 Tax=Dorcoceras hygrometricum TaxID=472368 RepID=A0A2Z7BVG9_9LAMI|nr:hypothetical protein F511_03944 [Dorcoceras hygrometricum]